MLKHAVRGLLAAAGAVLCELPAAAQCVMCYTTTAGSGARTIEALKMGILIMLVPTLAIFAGIFFLVYRRRDSWGGELRPGKADASWKAGPSSLPGAEPEVSPLSS